MEIKLLIYVQGAKTQIKLANNMLTAYSHKFPSFKIPISLKNFFIIFLPAKKEKYINISNLKFWKIKFLERSMFIKCLIFLFKCTTAANSLTLILKMKFWRSWLWLESVRILRSPDWSWSGCADAFEVLRSRRTNSHTTIVGYYYTQ